MHEMFSITAWNPHSESPAWVGLEHHLSEKQENKIICHKHAFSFKNSTGIFSLHLTFMQAWEFDSQKLLEKAAGEEVRKVSWEADGLKFKW